MGSNKLNLTSNTGLNELVLAPFGKHFIRPFHEKQLVRAITVFSIVSMERQNLRVKFEVIQGALWFFIVGTLTELPKKKFLETNSSRSSNTTSSDSNSEFTLDMLTSPMEKPRSKINASFLKRFLSKSRVKFLSCANL
jgi:hypothetical protein